MADARPHGHVQFTIVKQEHSYEFNPNGPRTGQWTITFQTPSGVQSEITVPDSQYNKERVAAAIAYAVHHIEEVQSLTSGHIPSAGPQQA